MPQTILGYLYVPGLATLVIHYTISDVVSAGGFVVLDELHLGEIRFYCYFYSWRLTLVYFVHVLKEHCDGTYSYNH